MHLDDPAVQQLIGRSRQHLMCRDDGFWLHGEVDVAFSRMQTAAREDGIELKIVSSFRDYERQLLIWREKVAGKRNVYSVTGELIKDTRVLSDEAMLAALLRWSALPGLSRHHWGTDFDVYDAAAMPQGYQLQLTPEEYQTGGPFERLSSWLQQRCDWYGFALPYAIDHGGVAPEPWHISFQPVASRYEQLISMRLFEALLDEGLWPLESIIRPRAQEIFQRYVCNQPC